MYGLVRIISRGISGVVQRNNRMIKNARKLKSQLRNIHQTAGQAEKVQKLVKENRQDELAAKIQQTANYDKEFREFINDFNKKHKGRMNLLDLSNYAREYKDLSKPGLSEQDMKILEEFRKRRLEMKARDYISTKKVDRKDAFRLSDDLEEDNRDMQEQQQQQDENPEREERVDDGQEDDLQEKIKIKTDEMDQNDKLKQGHFEIQDSFIIMMIDRDAVTKVTTLNRIMSQRVLVFMGNGLGVISYGRGKGLTPDAALSNAIRHAKQNLIAIPIDYKVSVPQKIHVTFQDYDFTIKPCTYFNSWGDPVVATMLSLAGLIHCSFKTVHTDSNNYPMLNSFFKAVTKNTTPQQLAERKGFKVYRHQWVKPFEPNHSTMQSYRK